MLSPEIARKGVNELFRRKLGGSLGRNFLSSYPVSSKVGGLRNFYKQFGGGPVDETQIGLGVLKFSVIVT